MATKVKPIPDGFHSITPYLIVDGAAKIIDFAQKAFDAKLHHEATKRPDGSIMHATLKIGDSMLMISDTSEQAKATTTMLYLYVPDVDATYQKALKAGGTSVMEPADQFYGDRTYRALDCDGHVWNFRQKVAEMPASATKDMGLTERAGEFRK